MSVIAAFAVPHPPLAMHGVGQGREEEIRPTLDAYREVGRRVAALAPDVLVVSSPHATCYYDYLHVSPGTHARGDFANFGDPADVVACAYDAELVRAIERQAALAGLPCGTQGEKDPTLDHGTMVPLAFLQAQGVSCPVVRMGIAGLSAVEHYRIGQLVARACDELGRRAVWVASGDLSHKLLANGPYGFAEQGPVFDRLVCDAFAAADFAALLACPRALADGAAECGLRSFQMMAGAFDGRAVAGELLSYEGPFGVGYGVAAFTPGAPDETRHLGDAYEAARRAELQRARDAADPWAALARASLERWVRDAQVLEPGDAGIDLPDELLQTRAGAFCSVKKNGELRGCIGTIAPTRDCLAREIVENAIGAACRDPRFPPIEADELPDLEYSVDVLGPAEKVEGPQALDPGRYGVIVSTRDGRRGLLLPDLDGVDTVADQIRIARRKGGIGPDEPVTLERFEVVRHV